MEKSEFLKNLGYRLIDASANIVECPNKHIILSEGLYTVLHVKGKKKYLF
ncbi:hypothetical protein [Campylobacter phage CJLB-10]|nr:hypothetical protein [Campylobacter phage CJLB-10]